MIVPESLEEVPRPPARGPLPWCTCTVLQIARQARLNWKEAALTF